MGGAFDFANPSDLLRGPAKLDLAGVVSPIFREGVQPATRAGFASPRSKVADFAKSNDKDPSQFV